MAGLIALTGATGFLGQRLAPHLLAQGWSLRALARRPPIEGEARKDDLEWVLGDLADAGALARLAAGAQVFVHLAGAIMARDRAGFLAVNEAGAAAAARAAKAVGARFVLVSSLAARQPQLSSYAFSKHAGELAAREVLGGSLTIIRPPAVYGPGDRATLGLFQLAAHAPILPYPGAPTTRLALAHVDDVAAEIAEAARRDEDGLFALGGHRPQGYGWREIWRTARSAFNRNAPLMPLPVSLIHAAGGIADLASRLTGRPAIFGAGKARELTHPDWAVSPSEMAPWRSGPMGRSLDQGFTETAAWYRLKGWL